VQWLALIACSDRMLTLCLLSDSVAFVHSWEVGATAWAGRATPTQNFGWVGHNAFGPTNNWPVCSLVKLV